MINVGIQQVITKVMIIQMPTDFLYDFYASLRGLNYEMEFVRRTRKINEVRALEFLYIQCTAMFARVRFSK